MPRGKTVAKQARNTEIARLFTLGWTVSALAARFVLSPERVKQILTEEGHPVLSARAQGVARRRVVRELAEEAEQLRAWFATDGRQRPEVFQRRLEAHAQRALAAIEAVA